MKRIFAAVLTVAALWFGAGPTSAAEECHNNSCATATVIPTPDGWSTHFVIRGAGSAAGYDFYNLRVPGHPQMDLQGTRLDLTVSVAAGWDGAFSLQACINNFPLDSNCDSWSTFRAELPIASDDRNFCVRYAGHATSEASSAQQQNCGFETASGRWSTDNALHLNWCLGLFRGAGGVPDKLGAARNLANSEDAIRIKDLQACQAKATAQQTPAPATCPAGQVFSSNDNSCIIPRPADAGGALQMSCKSGPGMSGVEEVRGLLVTFAAPGDPQAGMPGPGECIIADRPLLPGEPRKLLVPPVDNSNRRLLAEAVNGGTFQLHVTTREDAFRVTSIDGVQVMGGSLPPAPAPGGQPTTSTCGLPGGTATVVIANPEITSLNVRDKPAGAIVSTIAAGSQVNIVGGCGVKIAAGLVADARGAGQAVPGWCAISAPMVGCVSEQFLVAGIPAGAQPAPAPAAGLVANQPQNAPAPEAAPASPPPPPVAAADQPTTSTCGLVAGAATVVISDPAITILNVRDRPAGDILTTIPTGAQVTVVGGCGVKIAAGLVAQAGGGQPPVPGWCAISSPVVGCVSEQFLMSGIQAAPAPAAGLVANQPQPAPAPAPPPPVADAAPAANNAGGQIARLTQGANIRNGAGRNNTAVLQSLPGGSTVTVLGCESGWCRLAMPQYAEAWVFQDFLAFDGGGGQAPAPAFEVTINLGGQQGGSDQGGGQQGGGEVAPPPPPPGGEQPVTSTCGLPGGTAMVVIPDPNVPSLNIRDKPAGIILNTIPKGSQVNVVGGCGLNIAAGLVAPAGGGQPPVPGWCAISSPMIGCVSEQFLVAGIPADQPAPAPAAGLVANQPQPAPAPEAPPPPPPVADVAPTANPGGGQTAHLKQGANIRNGAGNKKTRVLESLPGGSTVTVLGCQSGWCRLAMPQYREAWIFQDFLAFDGGAGPGPAPAFQVTINLGGKGGGQQGGGEAAPSPAPGGDQPTTSTCGVPGGTATVVIPDPNVPNLNVREGPSGNSAILATIPRDSQVNVVGGCGGKIAAGLVAQAPGDGPPPVSGWCAISQPVVGCVSEKFLVAGIVDAGQPAPAPAAGLVADQPQDVTTPTFTGTWDAEAQGASFAFNLTQDGKSVFGSYSGSDGSSGQIKGKLKGNVLRFTWRQTDNLSGAGKFGLSADGNSFSGSYTMGNNPDVADGAWNGTRR